MLVKNMLDGIKHDIKSSLEDCQEPNPCFRPMILLGKPKSIGHLHVNINDDRDKEVIVQFLLTQIQEGVIEVAFICEAWAVQGITIKQAMQWKRDHGSLQSHPKHGECIIITYQSYSEEVCFTAMIKR